MKISILAIGKIKEKYLQDGISEYLKRISPYCKINILEFPDAPIRSNDDAYEIEKAKISEGKNVLKAIKANDYVVALDLNKKQLDSIEFSSFVMKSLEIGASHLVFVIGGSYGLSDELKSRANTSISLSKMTFLHQMTRLILLEQIYRAFKITNNETYHK